MNKIKLGVIGCGVIGSRHIAAAAQSPYIELIAIADLRVEVAQKLAAEHGVTTIYQDADSLIQDDRIEAVVLAMPARYRTALAIQAFAVGKHVLTEKPVALNADEVKQMITAQGELVAACCSSRFHFLKSTKVVADFIATGALGKLRVLRCRAIQTARPRPEQLPPNWRLDRSLNGGGIMSNWGCYDLDYLLGITGWSVQPQTVLGQTWSVPGPYASHVTDNSNAETHLTALIRCQDDISITYERGEYVAAAAENSWEVIGEQGSLTLQMTGGPGKKIIQWSADTESGVHQQSLWHGDEDSAVTMSGPVEDFAHAILEKRPPQTNLQRALVVQQITDAIYASSEQGVAIQIH